MKKINYILTGGLALLFIPQLSANNEVVDRVEQLQKNLKILESNEHHPTQFDEEYLNLTQYWNNWPNWNNWNNYWNNWNNYWNNY